MGERPGERRPPDYADVGLGSAVDQRFRAGEVGIIGRQRGPGQREFGGDVLCVGGTEVGGEVREQDVPHYGRSRRCWSMIVEGARRALSRFPAYHGLEYRMRTACTQRWNGG